MDKELRRLGAGSAATPALAGEPLEARIAALPLWDGPAEIAPLGGGLSNTSFIVTDRSGRYAVRFGGDYPFHGVERARELEVARAAHAAGFAPEVVYDEPGLMVSRFIAGKVFTAADVRANIPRIAGMLRRFHAGMAPLCGPMPRFDVFAVIRGYGALLDREGASDGLARLLGIAAGLEAALPPALGGFGHHDLLPANLIDDGERLWLIDFEYAAPGDILFDLGGLASNAGFDADESDALLAAYFGEPPAAQRQLQLAGMASASLLREALWAKVSALHLSAPGADYTGYAASNLERFEAALVQYREGLGALPS